VRQDSVPRWPWWQRGCRRAQLRRATCAADERSQTGDDVGDHPSFKPELAAGVKPPFAMRRDWHERRAAARRYEVLVGIAAYLALTWEGEALLVATVVGILGGYVALRAVLGN
jgi:hypothetical protein